MRFLLPQGIFRRQGAAPPAPVHFKDEFDRTVTSQATIGTAPNGQAYEAFREYLSDSAGRWTLDGTIAKKVIASSKNFDGQLVECLSADGTIVERTTLMGEYCGLGFRGKSDGSWLGFVYWWSGNVNSRNTYVLSFPVSGAASALTQINTMLAMYNDLGTMPYSVKIVMSGADLGIYVNNDDQGWSHFADYSTSVNQDGTKHGILASWVSGTNGAGADRQPQFDYFEYTP